MVSGSAGALMRRPVRWFLPVLGAVFAAASFHAAAADPAVIRIAAVAIQTAGKTNLFGTADYVSQDKDLKAELDKRHISIEWVPASSVAVATLVNEAFASHRIDFAFYGDLPSIILNASGVPTRLVAPGNLGNNVYLVVPPGSTAKSIVDLKGKRIALN